MRVVVSHTVSVATLVWVGFVRVDTTVVSEVSVEGFPVFVVVVKEVDTRMHLVAYVLYPVVAAWAGDVESYVV